MERDVGQSSDRIARKKLLRALRLLAQNPATQLVDRPLDTLRPLIVDGYASVTRQWQETASGKLWHCEEVAITDAGRQLLKSLEN
jgi:hypothetical protein